jgi:high-affinity nickel permease
VRSAAETATVLSSRKTPTTHNITIMGLSVAVALVVATIELGALIPSELDLSGSFWSGFSTST